MIFAHPLIRKFLNNSDPLAELQCPNCKNYADAFNYLYVDPFRKFLNATELFIIDDDKAKRPTRYMRFAMRVEQLERVESIESIELFESLFLT